MYKIDFRVTNIYNPHCVMWVSCVKKGLLKIPFTDCRCCRYYKKGYAVMCDRVWRQVCDEVDDL